MSVHSSQYIGETAKHPCTASDPETHAILKLKYHTMIAYVNLRHTYLEHNCLYYMGELEALTHKKIGQRSQMASSDRLKMYLAVEEAAHRAVLGLERIKTQEAPGEYLHQY